MLTHRQAQCLQAIRELTSQNGVAPSFDELKDYLGLGSKSGVQRLIVGLEERGRIRRLPFRARALEVVDGANLPALPPPAPKPEPPRIDYRTELRAMIAEMAPGRIDHFLTMARVANLSPDPEGDLYVFTEAELRELLARAFG